KPVAADLVLKQNYNFIETSAHSVLVKRRCTAWLVGFSKGTGSGHSIDPEKSKPIKRLTYSWPDFVFRKGLLSVPKHPFNKQSGVRPFTLPQTTTLTYCFSCNNVSYM